ncbi:histidinol-phosphatase [Treponema endosymbiont of Eucomonympha sp.]|uniref:histidinol-phosphatase n=1 Tax=Treponema endosymbiont of Eucomonympha sp. TaxID=1580831 RepID=UPI000784D513|nr:histidinol-phosphatase [Treponema endosymbiont of Eucomonympha sp.]
MPTNFHTHTSRCKHATGSPKDYIERAARDGCTELGISDHCPYPRDGTETWSSSRMEPEELPLYVQDVRAAAKNAPFPVRLGFECEWAPRYASWYRDVLLGECRADYLVFGAHWLFEAEGVAYAPDLTDKPAIRRYFAQTIQGLESGLFRFLAHPDLLMGGGLDWDAELAAGFSALIDAARSLHIPLEINGYGLAKPKIGGAKGRYQYPVDEFWELVAEKGAEVICSSDAHSPDCVIRGALDAAAYAARFGLSPVETIF